MLAAGEPTGRPCVDVSTVDAFQGDEREIVVITTARVEKSSFIEAKERVNVALSRARTHLIIVTNVTALFQSDIWGSVFNAAQRICTVRAQPAHTWAPFDLRHAQQEPLQD
jgi:hypothetical protein